MFIKVLYSNQYHKGITVGINGHEFKAENKGLLPDHLKYSGNINGIVGIVAKFSLLKKRKVYTYR
jgi:hypothetical protein